MGMFGKKVRETPEGFQLGRNLPLKIITGFGKITTIGYTTIYELPGNPGMYSIKNGSNQVTCKLNAFLPQYHSGNYLGKVDLQMATLTGIEFKIVISASGITLIALQTLLN